MPEKKEEVDAAMADTFPASDPPSWGGGITGVRDATPRPERRPPAEEGEETEAD